MWPEIEPYRTRHSVPNVIKGIKHIIKRIVVDKRLELYVTRTSKGVPAKLPRRWLACATVIREV
jgi:hypothetical protein